jgi:hypothetical protein
MSISRWFCPALVNTNVTLYVGYQVKIMIHVNIIIWPELGAAYQHFKRSDLDYGFLTLFFVYLPGED